MFNKDNILKVQRQRRLRGQEHEVINVDFKTGQSYSGYISPEQNHILQEWLNDGNTIEPPPPKRGTDLTTSAFHDHPLFILPDDRESTVWRYMNFDQFVSLLNSNALWFSRGHVLKQLEPYEGRLPLPNVSMDMRTLAEKVFHTQNLSQEQMTQSV